MISSSASGLIPSAVLIACVVVVFAVMTLRRRRIVLRAAEEARQENFRRQEFLLTRLDLIGRALANRELADTELRNQAEALLAEMETENIEGDIDALIADTRLQLEEEIARRSDS